MMIVIFISFITVQNDDDDNDEIMRSNVFALWQRNG